MPRRENGAAGCPLDLGPRPGRLDEADALVPIARHPPGGHPMRLLRTILLVAPLLTLVIQGILPRPSNGLPLFARKYGVACTTCHLAFPRLNSFGMAFRQNGYRMPAAKGT